MEPVKRKNPAAVRESEERSPAKTKEDAGEEGGDRGKAVEAGSRTRRRAHHLEEEQSRGKGRERTLLEDEVRRKRRSRRKQSPSRRRRQGPHLDEGIRRGAEAGRTTAGPIYSERTRPRSFRDHPEWDPNIPFTNRGRKKRIAQEDRRAAKGKAKGSAWRKL